MQQDNSRWEMSASRSPEGAADEKKKKRSLVETEGGRGGRERERENSNSSSKTLFYKDCSLGSVKTPSNN